eukprot:3966389-Pleurochrysis_carterae.AAC.1
MNCCARSGHCARCVRCCSRLAYCAHCLGYAPYWGCDRCAGGAHCARCVGGCAHRVHYALADA